MTEQAPGAEQPFAAFRSPEELQADIAELRAEVGATVAELSRRVDAAARFRARRDDLLARARQIAARLPAMRIPLGRAPTLVACAVVVAIWWIRRRDRRRG